MPELPKEVPSDALWAEAEPTTPMAPESIQLARWEAEKVIRGTEKYRNVVLAEYAIWLADEVERQRKVIAALLTACEATEVEEIALSWADSDVKTRRINELAEKGLLSGPGPFIPGAATRLRREAIMKTKEIINDD